MTAVSYINYDDEFLGDFIGFWNSYFADRRNFIKVTTDRMRDRCFGRKEFDPNGLFLAIDGGEIVGIGHAGFPTSIDMPAQIDRSVGVIHLLYVSPRSRDRGIGGHLLGLCEEYLRGVTHILIGINDWKGWSPFYGAGQRSLLPLWGSSEGIGISSEDSDTKHFLFGRGFAVLGSTVSMLTDLRRIERDMLPPTEISIQTVPDRWIMCGGPLESPKSERWRGPCESHVYVEDGCVKGKIVTYNMEEVVPGREAIIDFMVEPAFRGRGIGRALLRSALRSMLQRGSKECELNTSPVENRKAFLMYLEYGFQTIAEWLSFEKACVADTGDIGYMDTEK